MRRLQTLLAVACLTGLLWITVSGKSSSACDRQRADLECVSGERIAIRGVEYSVRDKRERPCSYKKGDCRFRVNSDVTVLSEQCAGHTICPIEETHLNYSAKFDGCPGTALYRTIHYDCIPDKNIARICNGGEIVGKTLYLANGEYPLSMKGVNSECLCSISSNAGTKVIINVNELTLSSVKPIKRTEVCKQILNISDSSASRTFDCSHRDGYYGYREIFNGGPDIEVEFRSEAGENGGRFLLEIKGSEGGDLIVKCQKEEETPTAVHSHPAAPPPDDRDSASGVDAIAVGLGAAGGVIVIVCVAAVICLLKKRKKDQERKPSDRTMDIGDGVVDPFIVTADSGAVSDSRNGTGTFRQGAQKPAPHEIVYATPGYAAPWDSHAIPAPPLPVSPPLLSSPPLPSSSPPPLSCSPPLPSEPPLPALPPSQSCYKNEEPTHYTYIVPDILDHVTPKKGNVNKNQERPKPVLHKSSPESNPVGNVAENGKDGGILLSPKNPISPNINTDISVGPSDADTIFVYNDLYQHSVP